MICRPSGFALLLTVTTMCSLAQALETGLNLPLLPTTSTTNRLDVTLNLSGITDSELTRVSGNILTNIEYDLYLGAPLISGIEFTGGNLRLRGATTDDIHFDLNRLILGTNIDVDGTNLSGQLDTPTPPSIVTEGTFAAADHALQLNSGLLTAEGTAGFIVPVNEMVDLSQETIPLETQGDWSVQLVPTGSSGRVRTYDVTVSLPIDASYPVPVNDTTTLDVDATGTIVARNTWSILLPLEGDYNGDGRVSLADYPVWRDTLGATGPGLAADGNFDWVVDEQDYALWSDNFGNAIPRRSAAHAAAVPESSSLLMASAGVLLTATGIRAAKNRDARETRTPRR